MTRDIELAQRYYKQFRYDDPALFLEERNDCPWCNSLDITRHLDSVDLIKQKQGRFVLDRCRHCLHIFQNPRLSEAGLGYYYRDFYDGLGATKMRKTFAGRRGTYRRRARAIAAVDPHPAFWLDVGTGYGHFCETARTVFPDTRFHGIDASEGIDDGLKTGRIHAAFKESLAVMSARYPECYDVISMYHYLEHTTDPKAQLRHAADLLKPGGLLVIEVPNTHSPMSRWLGRYWLPWLQPQHLHFVPSPNLAREMIALGLSIEHCDSGDPHDPLDLTGALLLALHAKLPRENAPWSSTSAGRISLCVRAAAWLLALPFLAIARVVDLVLLGPLLRLSQRGNAYRLIARKPKG
ncbi:class I SAM-dependent methyltransferase [Dyella sp. GSA-30]|uniref:class I SAM-dependent methyltransferase n=1 Tax=Dyella sp. GSA-30 TaxID=2994496 RepID=UPI0024915954|nr:class I SAM-dependent methyltransferase [Dyella sp. GSA-30]BDU18889.1 methyltransferase type 12 [Dyella sp. GSA-30]